MRFNDAVFGFAAIALAAYIFFAARGFPASAGIAYGPGFFPMLLAIALGGCGGILLVRGFRTLPAGGWARISPQVRHPRTWVGFAMVLASLVGYSVLDDILGFHLTAILLTAGFMVFLGVRLRLAIFIAVLTSIVVYVIFARILLVPLPPGPLAPLLY